MSAGTRSKTSSFRPRIWRHSQIRNVVDAVKPNATTNRSPNAAVNAVMRMSGSFQWGLGVSLWGRWGAGMSEKKKPRERLGSLTDAVVLLLAIAAALVWYFWLR